MATKDESPTLQHEGSTEEDYANPKKRRKVNHGRYDIHTYKVVWLLIDVNLNSMYILPAIGKQLFQDFMIIQGLCWLQSLRV